MNSEADLKRIEDVAKAQGAAASALLSLLQRDLALGIAALLRCILWTLLGLFAASATLLLLVAGAVALGLWLGLAWPWALLGGALGAGLLAAGCARLARRRLGEADLAASRRQLRALLASLAGTAP